MKNDITQADKFKKPSPRRYIFPAVFVIIFFCVVSVYIMLTQEPKPDPASEAIIRKAAALKLNKDPNELTDEDFTKIKYLVIDNEALSDIRFVGKFEKIEKLNLNRLQISKNRIPIWMKFMTKLGILNSSGRIFIDLEPLQRLKELQMLDLSNLSAYEYITSSWLNPSFREISKCKAPIKNIEPLSSLTNLTHLYLSGTYVKDIKPLKTLKNLQVLDISNTGVSNLEPLYHLKNLKVLSIYNCPKIKIEQIEELYKNLPELEMKSFQRSKNVQFPTSEFF